MVVVGTRVGGGYPPVGFRRPPENHVRIGFYSTRQDDDRRLHCCGMQKQYALIVNVKYYLLSPRLLLHYRSMSIDLTAAL